MRLDEFSISDGSFSTADIARMLLFGFDIALSPPAAIDLSTAVVFPAIKKTIISIDVTQKTAIAITQVQGGSR